MANEIITTPGITQLKNNNNIKYDMYFKRIPVLSEHMGSAHDLTTQILNLPLGSVP